MGCLVHSLTAVVPGNEPGWARKSVWTLNRNNNCITNSNHRFDRYKRPPVFSRTDMPRLCNMCGFNTFQCVLSLKVYKGSGGIVPFIPYIGIGWK